MTFCAKSGSNNPPCGDRFRVSGELGTELYDDGSGNNDVLFGPDGPTEEQLRDVVSDIFFTIRDQIAREARASVRLAGCSGSPSAAENGKAERRSGRSSNVTSGASAAQSSAPAGRDSGIIVAPDSVPSSPQSKNLGSPSAEQSTEQSYKLRGLARYRTYTNVANLEKFIEESLAFVRQYSEYRTKQLQSAQQIRFLVTFQHFVMEDTRDLLRPARERKHDDTFEGIRTCSINTQMIKDLHRAEWSIEGEGFSYAKWLRGREAVAGKESGDIGSGPSGSGGSSATPEEFQMWFVRRLEDFFLASFANKLTTSCLDLLMRAITTQMCQCGLANLDRGSRASRYFLMGGSCCICSFRLSRAGEGIRAESV